MRFISVIVLTAILILASACEPEEISISGKLLNCENKPFTNAFVKLSDGKRIFTDIEGRFSYSGLRPGVYKLFFSGVQHKAVVIPLIVEKSIEFEVQLAAVDIVENMDSIYIIGDFNEFSTKKDKKLMKKLDDGNYQIEMNLDSDSLAYQILGVQKGNLPLSGTLAYNYNYNNKTIIRIGKSGNFNSIVKVKDGKVIILFNPNDLPNSDQKEEVVSFNDEASLSAQIYPIYKELDRIRIKYIKANQAYRSAGKDPRKFEYDWTQVRKGIKEKIKKETNQLKADYLRISYFTFGQPFEDSLFAREIFKEVAPASYVWSLTWDPTNLFYNISRISKDLNASESYMKRIVEENPDSMVKAGMLFNLLANKYEQKNDSLVYKYYYELKNNYGRTPFARFADRFSPEQKISKGNNIPKFSVSSLEDSTLIISDKSLLGRTYLIDFWAVWCGPCVGEMENLHKAYNKYRDNGFTILSISLDKKPNDVFKFRKDKWSMPWLNSFLEGGFNNSTAKTFEVFSIPRPILVNEKGKIIATGTELRGQNLEMTLAKFFQ